MGGNAERLDAVLRRRGEQLPKVAEQTEHWRQVLRGVRELAAAVASAIEAEPVGPVAELLAALDVAGMEQAARRSLDALDTVRARMSRETVNIGVSGRARNGKSTLLQSLTGLGDRQIPSGRGQAVTAVRSRIFHSPTDHGARLRMHTEESFIGEVVTPYHTELGLTPTPRDLDDFAGRSYPGSARRAEDQALHGPMLARLREAQRSLGSYRGHLTGGERTVDLADIRDWVAYPDGGATDDRRPYLAVRDAVITCAFPIDDVIALGLVDLPGLGELVPGAEEHHIAGLRNDVDFVIVVKWAKDANAIWSTEDAQGLRLIVQACGAPDVRDFTLIMVNTGECLPENVASLQDDLRNRVNAATGERGYWNVAADAADPEAVRGDVLRPVLDHLAAALPGMDALAIADAERTCAAQRETVAAGLARLTGILRAIAVPTLTEHMIERARALRSEVSACLQDWVDVLQTRAQEDHEDAEFLDRIAAVHDDVRSWMLDGFGEGPAQWQKRALDRFRDDVASHPFAVHELNGIRVQLARRFAAVDDLLTERRDAYLTGLVGALGPLRRLVDEQDGVQQDSVRPEEVLRRLAAALGGAPDPCPGLAETLEFAVDVRLDYRTRMLPQLRRALEALYPERVEAEGAGSADGSFVVPRTAEGAETLLRRVTELARQAAYDAKSALLDEPVVIARVLLAYAQQFEDAFIRSETSVAEFRRLTADFEDRLWPGEATGGPQAVTRQLQRLRRAAGDLRDLLHGSAAEHSDHHEGTVR